MSAAKWFAVVVLGFQAGVASGAVPAGCYVDAQVEMAWEKENRFLATGTCLCYIEAGLLISENPVQILASYMGGKGSVPKVNERLFIAKNGNPAEGIDGIFIVISVENGLRGTSVLVPADEPINVFLREGESLDRSILSIQTIGSKNSQTIEAMRL